jgi:hypothetical protein
MNALLLGQIQLVFNLDGFTGDRIRGCRKGGHIACGREEPEEYDRTDDEDAEGGEADDVEKSQINGILDFVASL